MKQKLLMPHWCKVIGWVLMVPLALLGLSWMGRDAFSNVGRPKLFDFMDDNLELYISLLSVSMIMVAFSHERDEDEYVASVRGHYLMLAFYVDLVFLIITAFTVSGLGYIYIMALQMFLILLLHIVMFNIAMCVIRKRRGHEE